MFKDTDPAFLEKMSKYLQLEIFLAGKVILTEGDSGDKMYFLNRGEVEVLVGAEGKKVATLQSGSIFGEMALLGEPKRTATVRALDFCDCRTLHHNHFQSIMRQFPEERIFFQKLHQKRLSQLRAIGVERKVQSEVGGGRRRRSSNSWLTDLFQKHNEAQGQNAESVEQRHMDSEIMECRKIHQITKRRHSISDPLSGMKTGKNELGLTSSARDALDFRSTNGSRVSPDKHKLDHKFGGKSDVSTGRGKRHSIGFFIGGPANTLEATAFDALGANNLRAEESVVGLKMSGGESDRGKTELRPEAHSEFHRSRGEMETGSNVDTCDNSRIPETLTRERPIVAARPLCESAPLESIPIDQQCKPMQSSREATECLVDPTKGTYQSAAVHLQPEGCEPCEQQGQVLVRQGQSSSFNAYGFGPLDNSRTPCPLIKDMKVPTRPQCEPTPDSVAPHRRQKLARSSCKKSTCEDLLPSTQASQGQSSSSHAYDFQPFRRLASVVHDKLSEEKFSEGSASYSTSSGAKSPSMQSAGFGTHVVNSEGVEDLDKMTMTTALRRSRRGSFSMSGKSILSNTPRHHGSMADKMKNANAALRMENDRLRQQIHSARMPN